MDLLEMSGGGSSVTALAKQLGIGGADTSNLVEALAPALMRGLQKQTERPESMEGLTQALASGRHQRYLNDPDALTGDEALVDGNKILGHLFGSKDVSRNVAAQAAQETGLDSVLIKKALPILAGLAMGALSKKGQGTTGQPDSGILGGLIGSLLGGGNNSGGGLDDILGLAKKLF
jgi:hypothetical protein